MLYGYFCMKEISCLCGAVVEDSILTSYLEITPWMVSSPGQNEYFSKSSWYVVGLYYLKYIFCETWSMLHGYVCTKEIYWPCIFILLSGDNSLDDILSLWESSPHMSGNRCNHCDATTTLVGWLLNVYVDDHPGSCEWIVPFITLPDIHQSRTSVTVNLIGDPMLQTLH